MNTTDAERHARRQALEAIEAAEKDVDKLESWYARYGQTLVEAVLDFSGNDFGEVQDLLEWRYLCALPAVPGRSADSACYRHTIREMFGTSRFELIEADRQVHVFSAPWASREGSDDLETCEACQ